MGKILVHIRGGEMCMDIMKRAGLTLTQATRDKVSWDDWADYAIQNHFQADFKPHDSIVI